MCSPARLFPVCICLISLFPQHDHVELLLHSHLPRDSTGKSKCNSAAWRLLDFNFPDIDTAFTWSETNIIRSCNCHSSWKINLMWRYGKRSCHGRRCLLTCSLEGFWTPIWPGPGLPGWYGPLLHPREHQLDCTSGQSDQSLCVHMSHVWHIDFSQSTVQTLMRQSRQGGGSDSSLKAHAEGPIFSCCSPGPGSWAFH